MLSVPCVYVCLNCCPIIHFGCLLCCLVNPVVAVSTPGPVFIISEYHAGVSSECGWRTAWYQQPISWPLWHWQEIGHMLGAVGDDGCPVCWSLVGCRCNLAFINSGLTCGSVPCPLFLACDHGSRGLSLLFYCQPLCSGSIDDPTHLCAHKVLIVPQPQHHFA